MEASFFEKANRMREHLLKGENEASLQIAQDTIADDPSIVDGYLLMAYHYRAFRDKENAVKMIEEAIRIAPEDGYVLEFAIETYDSLLIGDGKKTELINRGLELYPESSYFHWQYAKINSYSDRLIDQVLAAYEKAVELAPNDEVILGEYVLYLYRIGRKKAASHQEKVCLMLNPENTTNLKEFAKVANRARKYKKAQTFIEEAMRLDPEDSDIRYYYRRIYPTKNPVFRTKAILNSLLADAFQVPARFIWRLIGMRIPAIIFMIIFFLTEVAGLVIWLKKDIYYVLAAYFVFLFISRRCRNWELKRAGYADKDADSLEISTKDAFGQLQTLRKMEEEVEASQHDQSRAPKAMPAEELEEELLALWGKDDLSSMKEAANQRLVLDQGQDEANRPSGQKNQAMSEENDKLGAAGKRVLEAQKEKSEYSKLPTYLITVLIIVLALTRFSLQMDLKANRASAPDPVDQAVIDVIVEADEKLAEEKQKELEDSSDQLVDDFLDMLAKRQPGQAIEDLSDGMISDLIIGKLDDAFLDKLKDVTLVDAYEASHGLGVIYYLVEHDSTKEQIFLEIAFEQVLQIYADELNDSEEMVERYEQLIDIFAGMEAG